MVPNQLLPEVFPVDQSLSQLFPNNTRIDIHICRLQAEQGEGVFLQGRPVCTQDNKALIWSSKKGHPVKRLLPKKNYSQRHLGFCIPKTNGDGDYYKTFRYT